MDDKSFWKIAGGVAAGILLAGAVSFLVRAWMVNQAVQEMQRTVSVTTKQMLQSAQRTEAKIKSDQERRKADAVRLEQLRRLEAAKKERAAHEAQQAAAGAEKARELAWQRYYEKPAHCDHAEGNAFVECGNHYIRAKRRFDQLYAEGKL